MFTRICHWFISWASCTQSILIFSSHLCLGHFYANGQGHIWNHLNTKPVCWLLDQPSNLVTGMLATKLLGWSSSQHTGSVFRWFQIWPWPLPLILRKRNICQCIETNYLKMGVRVSAPEMPCILNIPQKTYMQCNESTIITTTLYSSGAQLHSYHLTYLQAKNMCHWVKCSNIGAFLQLCIK
jgi:hypothetical protein